MEIILAIIGYMTCVQLYFSQVINPVDIEMEPYLKVKPFTMINFLKMLKIAAIDLAIRLDDFFSRRKQKHFNEEPDDIWW